MTLEATLERIAVALETIAKQGGTVAQATAELGKPDAAPPPATKTKPKANEKVQEAAANAAATAGSTTPPASAPAAATATSPSEPTWADALAKIQLVNKGTAAGQGREGVVALMAHFGFDPAKGDTVPKLQGLNKNAAIIAFADSLLNPVAPATTGEVDLGI